MVKWFKGFWAWVWPEDVVKVARDTTVQLCGFLPTVSTIVNILALGNPALTTGTAIASAICAAVTRNKAAHAFVGSPPETPPTVDGVMVEGEFVGK